MTISKKEVEEIIEKLGMANLDCGECRMCNGQSVEDWENYIHPILIGNVLKKIDGSIGGRSEHQRGESYNQCLITLWQKCGLTKSLQQISERELKDALSKEANDLFVFLKELL